MKKKIINYVQVALWLIAFVGLMVIILINKTESLYHSLYYVFMILWLVVPLILVIINVTNYGISGTLKKEAFMYMPLIGLSTFNILAIFRFIPTLDNTGKISMIIGTVLFLILSIASAVIIYKIKNYQGKYHLALMLVNYLLYLGYFGLSVYISYYHSLNWID